MANNATAMPHTSSINELIGDGEAPKLQQQQAITPLTKPSC
jgi:hypothetical protein